MLNKKYLVYFFSTLFVIFSFFGYFVIFLARKNPPDVIGTFTLSVILFAVCSVAVVFFFGNYIFHLEGLRTGLYVAIKSWSNGDGIMYIVCCRGNGVDYERSHIIRVDFQKGDIINSQLLDLLKNNNDPVPFVVARTRGRGKKVSGIYSLNFFNSYEVCKNYILS